MNPIVRISETLHKITRHRRNSVPNQAPAAGDRVASRIARLLGAPKKLTPFNVTAPAPV